MALEDTDFVILTSLVYACDEAIVDEDGNERRLSFPCKVQTLVYQHRYCKKCEYLLGPFCSYGAPMLQRGLV